MSHPVGNPEDQFSHVEAHIYGMTCMVRKSILSCAFQVDQSIRSIILCVVPVT